MRTYWTMLNLRTALALTTLGLSLGTLASLAACTVHNANHCALNEGACGSGMACSMCAIDNDGCVPAASVIEGQCLFLTGGASDSQVTEPPTTTTQPTLDVTTDAPTTTETTVDPTVSPTEPSTSSSTTMVDPTVDPTTESSTCTGPIVGSSECGGELPYCIDGDCVGCQNLSCPDIEPTKPACNENLGLCVECNEHSDCSMPEKPACNADTATCESCSSHDQCEQTACNLEIGQCFPTNKVLYVDNTTDQVITCSDDNPGWGLSKEKPLCTLQEAMTRLIPGASMTIKLKSGQKTQNLPSTVPMGDHTVAIVRYGLQVPSLLLSGADPALTVQSGNTVFMYDIAIYNSSALSDPLIECEDSRLWIDHQRIFTGKSAIGAVDCRVHVRRSTIYGHTVGAIDVSGTDVALAKLWLENTYVTDNTGMKFGAVRLGGKASADILYSTIALNASPVSPIDCYNDWSGTLTVRNSAIVDSKDHFSAGCGAVTPINTYESSEGDKAKLGSVFAGFAAGVFQAKFNGDLMNKAIWKMGDPRVDNDITLRPTMSGALDYAGADRPGN